MTRFAIDFGKVLRRARLAVGLSQEELAERAELDRTYPSLLERGLRQPSLRVFLKLSRALDSPPEQLLAELQPGNETTPALPVLRAPPG